jgi:hypothetical protein
MALRLFLIAAYLDPQKLGPGCLGSMVPLAGTPAEARKCRAMAYLLDPSGDAAQLKTGAAKPAELPAAQAGALKDFLRALRYYRAGQISLARSAAGREGVEPIFHAAPGMVDKNAFLQRCTDAACPTCKGKGKGTCATCGGKGTFIQFGRLQRCPTCSGQKATACKACEGTGVGQDVPDDVLRLVLRAELWAMDRLAGSDPGGSGGSGETNWSALLQERHVSPVLPLSLESLTEFDPRKCVYRNGAWVAP